jgi:DNA-binding transcriptional MerR regulator
VTATAPQPRRAARRPASRSAKPAPRSVKSAPRSVKPALHVAPPAPQRELGSAHPYKMKDLCELTGLPRQVIHFYIQQGLVPGGVKTGRNMAYYGPQHVERVQLVRQLQHERFLPLKAIKALLDGQEESFTASQRVMLLGVKERLEHTLVREEGREPGAQPISVDELLARTGVPREDLDRAIELGFVATRTIGGREVMAADQSWLLEVWGELRAAGVSRELGFVVDDLAIYEEAIGALFTHEVMLVASRVQNLPPERVATLLERALPLVHTLLTRYHAMRVRQFFQTLR